MNNSRFLIATMLLAGSLSLWPSDVAAQLYGFNIRGDQGGKSGTQAPTGIYVGAPLSWYTTDTLKNREGERVEAKGDFTLFLGGPLVNVVTPKKLFGAHYGFMAVLPIGNARVELPRFEDDPEAGISDMYLQPLNLGWHTPRADVLAGYGLFIPTGRYEAGATDNTGLGMWGHEVFAGTTVFLDSARAWHASTLGAVELHTEKRDSEARVGDMLTLEGGLGRDLLKGAASVGLSYFAQWKLTEDTLTGLPAVLVRGKNRVAGIGPEVTLPIASTRAVYGFVTVRYQWEVGARTTTEGDVFNVLAVFPLKPIRIP